MRSRLVYYRYQSGMPLPGNSAMIGEMVCRVNYTARRKEGKSFIRSIKKYSLVNNL